MNMHRNVVSCTWPDVLWEASCTPSHWISSLRQYLKYSTPPTGNSLVPNVTGIAYTDTSDLDSKYRAPSSSPLFALHPAHKMNASTRAREEAEDTYPALTSFAKQVPIQGQPKRTTYLSKIIGIEEHKRLCSKYRFGWGLVAQLVLEGKKGDELAHVVLDFDWMRVSLQARNTPRSLSSIPLLGIMVSANITLFSIPFLQPTQPASI
ncbi:hypothetical protein BDQ17DRAFT_505896 [Cyathus striatus]|nr:hypothetical protein BDQ17DRAFT_505896 [Cyathus striatus]